MPKLAPFAFALWLVSSSLSDAGELEPLRLPPFRAGETLKFSYETKVHNGQAGARYAESDQRMMFEIRVEDVERDNARIIFTLRNLVASGDYDTGHAFFEQFMNVPVEVQTDASGIPTDIVNISALKERLLASAMDQHAREAMKSGGEEFQKAEIGLMFSRQLLTMAAMQPRDVVAFGHTILESPVREPPSDTRLKISLSRSIDFLGIDSAHCTAQLGRKTTQTTSFQGKIEPPSVLETAANVSTSDGWITSLQETRTDTSEFVEKTDIQRLTANPCER